MTNPGFRCGSNCPCCPNHPSTGSIGADVLITPYDSPGARACGVWPPSGGPTGGDVFSCGMASGGGGLLFRVTCEDGNWVTEYTSFATTGWVEVTATIECPECDNETGKAIGYITFDATDGCENSGGTYYYDVKVEVFLEGPC